MHTHLGHPSHHSLPRVLRVTGGRFAVVRAALQLRCDACGSQHHPGPHLLARLRTDTILETQRPSTWTSLLDIS